MPRAPRLLAAAILLGGATLLPANELPPPAAATATPAASGADFDDALLHHDPEAAVRLARPRAEAGDPTAQFVLGLLTDIGAGVRLDRAAAASWLTKAADQGDLVAQRYLAWRCAAGFGADQSDPDAAARWLAATSGTPTLPPGLAHWLIVKDGRCSPRFLRAYLWMMDRAGLGDVTAEANLATVYLKTEWTKPDPAEHLDWLQKAAAQGDAASAELLAAYRAAGARPLTDPQLKEAVERATAAMRANGELPGENFDLGLSTPDDDLSAGPTDPVTPFALSGSLLRDPAKPTNFMKAPIGTAPPRQETRSGPLVIDVAEVPLPAGGPPTGAALERCREAAGHGDAAAALLLGWMAREGEPGPTDFAAARSWFEQAAAAGNAAAAAQLGRLYEYGEGVPADPAKAFSWTERAARAGDGWARQHLGWMCHDGVGTPCNDREAFASFEQAAQQGEPLGQAAVGYCQVFGFGTIADRDRGFDLLFATTRDHDDARIADLFVRLFTETSGYERTALLDRLRPHLDDPDFFTGAGRLPEATLAVLETAAPTAEARERAPRLIQQLIEHRRPQSLVVLARHAFLGQHLAYDPGRAREWARAAAAVDPRGSRLALAQIESVAGATEADRASALAELTRQTDAHHADAAWILAARHLGGIGCDQDPAKASELFRIALPGPTRTHLLMQALSHVHEVESNVPPSADAFARQRDAALARRPATAPVVPLFIFKPAYPLELREVGTEGEVAIRFIVTTEGIPVRVHAESTTHPLFAAAGEAAISRWLFVPARKEGRSVNNDVVQPLRFNLDHN